MNLGQLLILKVNELRWDSSLEHFLHRLQPGGIVVNAPLADGAESVSEFLCKVARTLPAVPFLALREEGGMMDPLRAFLPPLPSPRAAAEKGLAAVTRLGELVGAAFQLLGFNTNLAPLLDLGTPAAESISMARAFSPDPQQVAKCGAAFLRGLERHNVIACGKHFPGFASAQPSSATQPAAVSKSMAELWREDLLPFRALLPRLPLVLLSTAAYKAYDFDWLQSAGLSHKILEGLLRVKLGYKGVAIAYGLETEAVRGTLALGEAAVQALRAGCDMLLLQRAEAADKVREALSAGHESGKIPGPRIEQALKRIQLAKKNLTPLGGRVSRRWLDQMVREFADFSRGFAGCGRSEARKWKT
jgi:beta-N-acetylhexosaminidase